MKLSENVIHIVGTEFVTHDHHIVGFSWIIDCKNVQGISDQVVENSVGVFLWLFVDIEDKWQISLFRLHLDFFPVADLSELLESETGSIDFFGIFRAECDTHISYVVVFIIDEFTVRVNFWHDPGIVGHFFSHWSVQSISLGNDSWFEKACEVGIRNVFGIPSYILELALHENFWWVVL
jgi:hypothetical protein